MLLPDLAITAQAPTLVPPSHPTPFQFLYLSNLDDQLFLRFSTKYMFLYQTKDNDEGDVAERLRAALGRVLVYYYPLAGRLRRSEPDHDKLQVVCSGEGAVFVRARSDSTLQDFQRFPKPCKSWKKLLHRVEADSFLGVPPLVVQVTELCGGVVVCVGMSHCLCDGLGSSQFVHAWAAIAKGKDPFPLPCWERELLRPRCPPQIQYSHPEFMAAHDLSNLKDRLRADAVVRTSLSFTREQLAELKKNARGGRGEDGNNNIITSFEVLAGHVWRCWIRAMEMPATQSIKLLFSVNVRRKLQPQLPQGFYGNGFVLACAESTVKELTESPLSYAVKLVQKAKARVSDDYVRSMIDFLADRSARPDMVASLVISEWSRMELNQVDFGWGEPLHVGPLASDIYCLFLPSATCAPHALDVLLSVPAPILHNYVFYMRNLSDPPQLNE